MPVFSSQAHTAERGQEISKRRFFLTRIPGPVRKLDELMSRLVEPHHDQTMEYQRKGCGPCDGFGQAIGRVLRDPPKQPSRAENARFRSRAFVGCALQSTSRFLCRASREDYAVLTGFVLPNTDPALSGGCLQSLQSPAIPCNRWVSAIPTPCNRWVSAIPTLKRRSQFVQRGVGFLSRLVERVVLAEA